MERLTATAEHLNGSIVELEEQRNKLNADIIQAQVNESNLRNRYNTYRSLKDSKSVGRNVRAGGGGGGMKQKTNKKRFSRSWPDWTAWRRSGNAKWRRPERKWKICKIFSA